MPKILLLQKIMDIFQKKAKALFVYSRNLPCKGRSRVGIIVIQTQGINDLRDNGVITVCLT